MGVKWTKDQQKVIDLRNRNILVSAAAGSGKTAVLVERIISLIMDEQHPMDIDRMLIVTFTRAAANEMRERIGDALEKKLEEYPDNEHLQKQTTLLHHAQISTIHGFCSYVIQNYFHRIDLDPGYRMADEGEIKLIKADVAEAVLESCYKEHKKGFLDFVECYASGKTDDGIEDLVWNLYEYASSAPWPKEWLLSAKQNYQVECWEDVWKSSWMQYLWKDIKQILQELQDLAEENMGLLQDDHAPHAYEPMLAEDQTAMRYLAGADDYEEMSNRLRAVSFSRLSSKREKEVDPDIRDRIKENRDQIKEMVAELKERYFFASPEGMLETLKACKGPVDTLIELTLMFLEAFEEKKKEKMVLDFSDLEHLTLRILVEKREDGKLMPSDAAIELSEQFDEIMIDEYQDSNLVQEYLLTGVSALIRGQHNVFMVGDVKQSIYRFRQACPELFMEKLEHYTYEDSDKQKIGLTKNFRSRREVLDSVNFFFKQLMRREVGGVAYDHDAALYLGADFAPGNRAGFPRTEIMAVETKGEEAFADSGMDNKKELEARAVGMRIRQMVDEELIWDKKKGIYRPATYGDCVILLRTMSGWAETFSQTLTGMGIPAYCTSRTGYFSAIEVQTVLNFLQICDNPRQEIPYTAVLMSPFVGCTPEELAMIRCIDKEQPIYRCVPLYEKQGMDENLRKKLSIFLVLYQDVCEREVYTPIHELIWYLVQKSGYGDYISALPGGEQRAANVRMLVEKAVEYERTSYGGLYHFNRYIESLKKYEVDFGEANIAGEGENTVRIMSIHKSKGLEFPIVFVSGMEKCFNRRDLNGSILMDADFGVASSSVDFEHRVKRSTLMRGAFYRKALKESQGEELRVLYVAMTRAKEKLILTGTIAKFEEKMKKYQYLENREEEQLPISLIMGASNYWAWILPALVRKNSAVPIDLHVVSAADLIVEEAEMESQRVLSKEILLNWDGETVYDAEVKGVIEERFAYQYPYNRERNIPVKISVSELKHRYIEEEDALQKFEQPNPEPLIPEFMKKSEEERVKGAGRGTAYHTFMEHLDLVRCENLEQIQKQILQAKEQNYLTEAETLCLNAEDFLCFSKSSVGRRMQEAQLKKRLKREQPFVLGIPASEIEKKWIQDETVLVQGIIDAYFYEGEEIVLLDYKTDRIRNRKNGSEELINRYQVQLDYYAAALERLTGKKVKEKIIYSFTLNREIAII